MSSSFYGFKPAPVGLVDMGQIDFYNDSPNNPTFTKSDLGKFTGLFGEMVLNVTWAQLQPVQGGPLRWGVIDDAITAVTTYNQNNPGANLGIKLRIWGGFTAPDWAKNIDGPPITITGQALVDRQIYAPRQSVGSGAPITSMRGLPCRRSSPTATTTTRSFAAFPTRPAPPLLTNRLCHFSPTRH